MKAVVLQVPEAELARRRRSGIDRYDEMWEGVLHMAPAPAVEHQRILSALDRFLGPLCDARARGVVAPGINVFSDAMSSEDYRIPDLTFVSAHRRHIVAPDGTRGGGPDAVIEVRSPQDETYDKLPFYAGLAVREVIVVQRDSREPEIYRLAGSQYVAVAKDGEGWLSSDVLKVRFRLSDSTRLIVEDLDDRSARTEI